MYAVKRLALVTLIVQAFLWTAFLVQGYGAQFAGYLGK